MAEELRAYIDRLFADAPHTQSAQELKEELYLNSREKMDDLMKNGATEEEAFNIVKRGIGDVTQLINGLKTETEQPEQGDVQRKEQKKKKSAVLRAASIALYIASPIFVIALGASGYGVAGVVCMLICIAVATALIIYSNTVYPKYERMDDTLVEEFREWKAEQADGQKKKNKYSGIIWPIIVAVYLLVSFTTGAWYITWIMFVCGAVVERIVDIAVSK